MGCANSTLLADLNGYISPVVSACLSPDGKRIVTSSYDNTAKIWDAAKGTLLTVLKGHTNWIYKTRFSPDGNMIVTMSQDKTSRIWDVQSGRLLADLKGRSDFIQVDSFSPDGKKIITSYGDTAEIWNTLNWKLLAILKGHTGWVMSARFSPDGKKIVTASMDSTAKIWNAVSGTLLANLKGHHMWLENALFFPDGKKILSVSNHTTRIWDAQTGAFLTDLRGAASGAYSACFSPDGKNILTASVGNVAKIWDAATGKFLAEMKGHKDKVNNAFFSADGKKIVTVSDDLTVKIWNAKTYSLMVDLKGFTSKVSGAFFSPDFKKLLTAATNEFIDPKVNSIKIWDVEKGNLLYSFFPISDDYFIQSPSGYYECSPNAAKLLHYITRELRVINFEQLDVKYNRPDLVLESIGYTDTSLIRSYKRAWQKRMKKLNFDTTLFRGVLLQVPEADFQNRDSFQYEQLSGKLSLLLKAKDDSLPLDRYNVWINEVPLFGLRGFTLKNRNIQYFDTTIVVTLSNGKNRIEVSATNVGGLESYRVPLDVNYTAPEGVTERLYFVGIGIDNFNDNRYNLSWSVKDIRDLARNFSRKYGRACNKDTLFDNKVSTVNVAALKQTLLKSTENDKVIVSYSGHGLLSKDYDYFLSTYNVDFQQPEKEGLPYGSLEDLLEGIPARKKLLLIDACHGGELDKEELKKIVQAQANFDSTKKGVIVLLDSTGKSAGTKNDFELMQQAFVNVGRSTGATVISAAAGTQFALERGYLKNGVFTYSILELMKQNKVTTVSALKQYVNQRVTELTNGIQVPEPRSENMALDWQVW